MAITSFAGAHRWLSNFWPAEVVYEGAKYPTVENAYQAAKWPTARRVAYRTCTPGAAKRLSFHGKLRPEWHDEKLGVMRGLLWQKFFPGSPLGDQLVATGDEQLVEGNNWGDTYWGVSSGVGLNHLGKLLMERRAELAAIDQVSKVYARRPGFSDWKAQVDAIATEEGLTPKASATQEELNTWLRHFNNGKTPAEAWRAVPYRRGF